MMNIPKTPVINRTMGASLSIRLICREESTQKRNAQKDMGISVLEINFFGAKKIDVFCERDACAASPFPAGGAINLACVLFLYYTHCSNDILPPQLLDCDTCCC